MADTQIRRQKSIRADRLRMAISLFLLAVFIGLAVLRGGNLWIRHDEILEEHTRRADGLAHVLSEHLRQTIATADAALSQIAAHSEHVGGPNAHPPFWEAVLQAAFSGLTGAGSITIVNDAGLIAHSTYPDIVGQSRIDNQLFRLFRDSHLNGLAAGVPFQSALGRGVIVPFARRLVAPNGSFDGIAAITIEPEQLRDFYRSVRPGEGALISIQDRQGTLLFQEPWLKSTGERATSDNLPRSDRAPRSALQSLIDPSGENYLTGLRDIDDAGLVLQVSINQDKVLSAWRREAWNSLGVLTGLGFLLMFAGYLINREIRARNAADLALEAHQARFHEIMYNAPIFVSVKDRSGRVRFINKALEELFGVSWKEADGKTLHDIAAAGAEPSDLISALDQEVVRTKAPLQRELNYQTPKGIRTALFVKFPLFDKNGEVESIASFSTDLTEQRRQETLFRTIMDNAPPLITVKGTDGKFFFVNRAQERAAGINAAELIGRTSHEMLPPDYADLQVEFDRAVIESRAPIQREFTAAQTTRKRALLFVKFPILGLNGDIEAIGSIATDVTLQRQAEAQLVHAQRMEAVGQLTGGIAHDFNNLLTVIIGNSEILAAELKNDSRLYPLAELTYDAAERSAALTKRLLAFGRRQMLEPKPTDVRKLVEDMEDLVARAAGARVKVAYRFAPDLWTATVDSGQLETAILNLVVNSRDAMPTGGRIRIEVSNVEVDESYIARSPDAKPGAYISIAVTDTGTGMPPEVVARVFEPFFTTKEVGKGTGLGLPTIYGFIKQSGGHVNIYSEVDHGTVVRLYVPRASAPSLVPELPRDDTQALPGGYESILLVEDDRAVRTFTERQLVELGYRVTTVSDPHEALKIARLTGRPDLLLTDIVMPGQINGRELAERLRQHWPNLKVLCTSGYTDGAPEVVDGLLDGFHFLSKPFRRRDLAHKVREALDTPVAAKIPNPAGVAN
jgi:PAS domain S-box-containing protein